MSAQAVATPRFVRRTALRANEYRRNFRQIDADVISAVTSEEADRVTPLMSKIYLRLTLAPTEFWEREGVLYFGAKEGDADRPVKASKVLYECLGVASATAHKALRWMHEQGIIGYFAGKNGAGIRIFLNRATGSIGMRATEAGKKILPFVQGSNGEARGSAVEPAFNDSFAVREMLDTDGNPRAPKNGADDKQVDKRPPDPTRPTPHNSHLNASHAGGPPQTRDVLSLDAVIMRLRAELEPTIHAAARQAAAREHERTREWLENRGLPKAARVAQHEAYSVLRKYGLISEASRPSHSQSAVGRNSYAPPDPHPLSADEVNDLAQACVALLETRGQSIEVTLSEMSSEAGGFLLPEDAHRVRERANFLISAGDGWEGK